MSTITKTVFHTSEQHVEIGTSRIKRDATDLDKLSNWLNQFNPFDATDSRLRSLSHGLVAVPGDGINCDDSEAIGRNIQKRLDNQVMSEVTVDNQIMYINPSILFMRLVVLIEREDDIEKYFGCELSPEPMVLFKNNFMRHQDKSSLAATLKSKAQTTTNKKKKRKINVCFKECQLCPGWGALLHSLVEG